MEVKTKAIMKGTNYKCKINRQSALDNNEQFEVNQK